eukprot:872859-Rhodomonas_salina.1
MSPDALAALSRRRSEVGSGRRRAQRRTLAQLSLEDSSAGAAALEQSPDIANKERAPALCEDLGLKSLEDGLDLLDLAPALALPQQQHLHLVSAHLERGEEAEAAIRLDLDRLLHSLLAQLKRAREDFGLEREGGDGLSQAFEEPESVFQELRHRLGVFKRHYPDLYLRQRKVDCAQRYLGLYKLARALHVPPRPPDLLEPSLLAVLERVSLAVDMLDAGAAAPEVQGDDYLCCELREKGGMRKPAGSNDEFLDAGKL